MLVETEGLQVDPHARRRPRHIGLVIALLGLAFLLSFPSGLSQGSTASIRLDAAAWVSAPDPVYGWWGAVPAGMSGEPTNRSSDLTESLDVPPGVYDLYWKQDLQHDPLQVASGIEAVAGADTVVPLRSGVHLSAATWVRALDASYGWWGITAPGADPNQPTNWARAPSAIVAPPGTYDIHWKQDIQHAPLRLAERFVVEADTLATFTIDSGLRLDIPSTVEAPEGTYGWWGIVAPGADPNKPLHWARGSGSIVATPGTYDVYWKQDLQHVPFPLFRDVTVETATLIPLQADTAVQLQVADWVQHPDVGYGWWGIVAPGGDPNEPLQWARAPATIAAPSGTFDIYWKQDIQHSPFALFRDVQIADGQIAQAVADSGMRLGSVLPIDPGYGWWGVTAVGASAAEPLHWTRDASAALILPPGDYDVYHKENLTAAPRLIAKEVEVARGGALVIDPLGGGSTPTQPSDDPPALTPPPVTSTPPQVEGAVIREDVSIEVASSSLDVSIRLEGVSGSQDAVFVAVDVAGDEIVLGPADQAQEWTAPHAGLWRIEARRGAPDGPDVVIASEWVMLFSPLATPEEAIRAGVTGAGIVIIGSRAFDLFRFLRSLFTQVGTDRARERTKDFVALDRWLKLTSAPAAGLAILLMAALVAAAQPGELAKAPFLRAFLVVGLGVIILEGIVTGGQLLLFPSRRAAPPYRLWTLGTVSLAVTSLAFRVPLGYTGYLDRFAREADAATRQRAAVTAVAGLCLTVGTVGVFLAAAAAGAPVFGETGILMALGALAISAMPVAPLPGYAVWRWSRALASALAICAFTLQLFFVTNAAPVALLISSSVAGAAAYGVLFWHARRGTMVAVEEAAPAPEELELARAP